MPTSVDNRIVEMRFDNRDFEKNTKQSMATLDKLKASLDMTDAENNFNKVSKASEDLSFREASRSADTFSVKLSAMSSVAVAAVGRLTNSLIDMGEQLMRNISGIDYISSGFSKYEEIVGYQQTMLNNAKNLSTDEMQTLLDKLVWFADETSFSADAMMQAMSSYISSGATEIEAQAAALGTALWAARTGNSNASLLSANYNLPQIFGKGYMQLEDWRSIVNAKMDAPWIRELFIETAVELDKLEKKADGFYTTIGKQSVKVDASSFTGTFAGKWLTTDVLLKTFAKLTKFTDKVYDEVQETGDLTFDVIKRLGDGVDDIGYKALKMAQETKTWSEAWAYIQGATTAGWSRTFEYIFGSYETAKEFFSDIVENLYTIFLEPGNTRNNLFAEWAEYTPKIAKNVTDTAEAVDDITTKLENARDIVLNIIRGNYGNGAARVKALAEKYGADAGRELQSVVNQVWKQWDGNKWSLNYELLDRLTQTKQVSSQTASALKEAAEEIEEAAAPLSGRDDFLDGLSALSEGIGNIFSEIYKWLDKGGVHIFNLTGEGLYEFTHKLAEAMRAFRDNSEDFDGTFLFSWLYSLRKVLEIIDNLTQPIRELFKSIGKGFIDAFFPEGTDSAEKMGLSVLHFLSTIERLTSKFRVTEEQAAKLQRIFQGLFTPFKIVGKILSSIADAIEKVINKTNKGIGDNTLTNKLLSIGEGISNIIIGFDEWLDKSGAIDKFIVPAVNFVSDALSTVWGWFKRILHIDADSKFPTFEDVFKGWQNAKDWVKEHIIQPINDTFHINLHVPTWDEITTGWNNVKQWIDEHVISPFEEITGKELKWPTWEGLKEKWEGFKTWFHDNVIVPFEEVTGIDLHWPTLDEVKSFFGKIWDFISNLFGAKKEVTDAGESVKEQGHGWEIIGTAFGTIWNVVKKIFELIGNIIEYLGQNETLTKLFDSAIFGGFLALIIKMIDALSGLGSLNPLNVLNIIGYGFGNLLNSIAAEKNAGAIKDFAVSIAILVGSLLVLALLPTDQLQSALIALTEMVGLVMGILSLLRNLFVGQRTSGGGLNSGNMLDASSWNFNIKSEYTTKTYDELTYSLLEIAAAIAILAVAIRIVAKAGDPTEIRNGLFAIEELLFVMVGCLAILNNTGKVLKSESKTTGKLFGNKEKSSSEETIGQVTVQFLSMAVLIYVLAAAIKKLSTIPNFDTNNGAFQAIERLLIIIEAMVVLVTKFSADSKSEKGAKVTAPLMGIMLMIVALVGIMAWMAKNLTVDQADVFQKVALAVTILVVAVAALVLAITVMAKEKTPKEKDRGALIKMAASIAIITSAMAVLITAITGALLVMLAIAKSDMTESQTKLAQEFMRTLILAVGIVAIFAVTMVATASQMKNSSAASLLGISAMIVALSSGLSVLVLSMAVLMSTMTTENSWKNALTVAGSVALVILGLLLFVSVMIGQLESFAKNMGSLNVLTTLLGLSVLIGALTAGLSTITLSMAVLAKNGSFDVILSIAGTLFAVIMALTAFVAVCLNMAKDLGGSWQSLTKLAGLAVVINTLLNGLALVILSISALARSGDLGTIAATVGLVAALIAVLALLVAALSSLSKNANGGANLAKAGAAFLGIAVGVSAIALSLGALTSIVSASGVDNLWQGTLAVMALMGAITAMAAIAAIPVVTAGFTAISVAFVAIGSTAVMFAVAIGIIVAALATFKDAIYDIADNGDRFEKGLDNLMNGLAIAISNAMPKFLKTIKAGLSSLPESVVDLIVGLLHSVNEKTLTIVKEIATSIILVLSSLKDYLGPIVATLLDFIVELLEGVAYAINTRSGKIVAAIMDVLVSIVVLTNTALGTIISSIFNFLGLGAIGDEIADWFGKISEYSATAFSKAGDTAIKSSEKVSKKIIENSPRLKEYYEKYGKSINTAIESGTDGITATLGLSGEKISDASNDAFSGFDISSLTNLTNGFSSFSNGDFGLDLGSLKSYGDSAGMTFSDGVESGIRAVEISKMFPTAEEFLQRGKEAGESALSGYGQSLYLGLLSNKFKDMQEVTDYIKEHGLENEEGIDELYAGIADGTIKSANEAIKILNSHIEEKAKQGKIDLAESAWNEIWTQKDADGMSLYKPLAPSMSLDYDEESGKVNQYQDDINGWISTLMEFEKVVSANGGVGKLESDTVSSLMELRGVLSEFGWEEYRGAIEIIDYLVGLDVKPNDSVYNSISKYIQTWKAELDAKALGEVISQAQDRIEEEKEKLFENTDGLLPASYFSDQRQDLIDKFNALEEVYREQLKEIFTSTDEDTVNAIKASLAVWLEDPENSLLYKWLENEYQVIKEREADVYGEAAEFYSLYTQVIATGSLDQQYEFNKFVSILAERIPEIVQMYSDLMGLDIDLPEANWSKIVGDPSSINSEQFEFLISYMYLLGGDVADSYVNGLKLGLARSTSSTEYKRTVNQAAGTLPMIFKDKLAIQSPSKVAKEIGEYFVMGLAEGIKASDEAGLASENAAKDIYERLKNAIQYATGINLDDLNPTIRPVLDLSNITGGADQISSLLGGQTYLSGGFGLGPAGISSVNAIAQLQRDAMIQAIKANAQQPINQTYNNTFNIHSNDPNEVARRVSTILSNQVQRKAQVWGPARANRQTQ